MPSVAALAPQLRAQGLEPVVTTDAVDHPPIRIALTTARDRLGLPHADGRAFLAAAGIPVKPAHKPPAPPPIT